MPDANTTIKNMTSDNLQRYAKLILTKAYAKAAALDTAASSAITSRIATTMPASTDSNYETALPTAKAVMDAIIAQHYVTIAKHVGNISTVANPSSTVLYFQKDSNDDPSWNIYIYAAVAGSDPVTYEWINVGDSELDLSGYFEKSDIITSTDDTTYTDAQLDTKVVSAKKAAADITAAVTAKAEALSPAGALKLVGTTATAGTTTTHAIQTPDIDINDTSATGYNGNAIPMVGTVNRALGAKLNANKVKATRFADASSSDQATYDSSTVYAYSVVESIASTKINTSAMSSSVDMTNVMVYDPAASDFNSSVLSNDLTSAVRSAYAVDYYAGMLNYRMLYKATYLEHLSKIFGLAKVVVKDASQLPSTSTGLTVGDKVLVTDDTTTGHNRGAYIYTVTAIDGSTVTFDSGTAYTPLTGDVNSKYNFANITTTTSEGAATANTAVYSALKSDELLATKFANANIVTTTNNLASSDGTVYSAAKADALLADKVNTSDVIDEATGINTTAASRSDSKVVSEAALGAKFDSIATSISTIEGNITTLSTNKVNYTDLTAFTDTEIADIVDAAAAELES